MRLVKHLGARSCPTDAAKVLMVVPFFPGEKISSVRMSGYFASGDASAIDQPGEINWYGLTIPWSLVFATELMDVAAPAVEDLGGVPEIDKLFTQYLRAVDESTGERFGGDADTDVEQTPSEEAHSAEELIDSGPIGVHQWFSREVVMQPLAAEGNTVIRFGDGFAASVRGVPGAAMGGLAMFGVVRFDAGAETNFNVELDDATSKEMMGLLIAGDYTKVQSRIQSDSTAKGDFIRTVLFGGDNYIEADTLKGPAGKAVVKASFLIDSPIHRNR